MSTPAPSIREQILAHIVTVTLPGTVRVSGRIYRSRQEAFSRSALPPVLAFSCAASRFA